MRSEELEATEKERDRATQTPTFMTFVQSPFYHFRPSSHLLFLIYLLGYVLYGGFRVIDINQSTFDSLLIMWCQLEYITNQGGKNLKEN